MYLSNWPAERLWGHFSPNKRLSSKLLYMWDDVWAEFEDLKIRLDKTKKHIFSENDEKTEKNVSKEKSSNFQRHVIKTN